MTIEHKQDAISTSAAIRPGGFRLDPKQSTVAFSAKKFGMFTIRGTMGVVGGSFTVATPVEHSSLHAVLAADSFRTPMARRDEHVKGKSLLDVATHPSIEFDSTAIVPVAGGWEIRGLLSVHGTVAPTVLLVTVVALGDGGSVHFNATARVDRRAFGVTGMRAAASSHIDVQIEAVGVPVGHGEAAA